MAGLTNSTDLLVIRNNKVALSRSCQPVGFAIPSSPLRDISTRGDTQDSAVWNVDDEKITILVRYRPFEKDVLEGTHKAAVPFGRLIPASEVIGDPNVQLCSESRRWRIEVHGECLGNVDLVVS